MVRHGPAAHVSEPGQCVIWETISANVTAQQLEGCLFHVAQGSVQLPGLHSHTATLYFACNGHRREVRKMCAVP